MLDRLYPLAVLFDGFSEKNKGGLPKNLAKVRDDNWVKEIPHVYDCKSFRFEPSNKGRLSTLLIKTCVAACCHFVKKGRLPHPGNVTMLWSLTVTSELQLCQLQSRVLIESQVFLLCPNGAHNLPRRGLVSSALTPSSHASLSVLKQHTGSLMDE